MGKLLFGEVERSCVTGTPALYSSLVLSDILPSQPHWPPGHSEGLLQTPLTEQPPFLASTHTFLHFHTDTVFIMIMIMIIIFF